MSEFKDTPNWPRILLLCGSVIAINAVITWAVMEASSNALVKRIDKISERLDNLIYIALDDAFDDADKREALEILQ